jgi:hypothetical protein
MRKDQVEFEILYQLQLNYDELNRIKSLLCNRKSVKNLSSLDLTILYKIERAYRSIYMLPPL